MPANHLESVTFSSQFVSITIAVHVSLLLPDERTEAEQMFLRWVSSRPLPWRQIGETSFLCVFPERVCTYTSTCICVYIINIYTHCLVYVYTCVVYPSFRFVI